MENPDLLPLQIEEIERCLDQKIRPAIRIRNETQKKKRKHFSESAGLSLFYDACLSDLPS